MSTAIVLACYTAAVVVATVVICRRVFFDRGVAYQKRMQSKLREYDDILHPSRLDDYQSGYNAVAAAIGLRLPPPAEPVIDLRDTEGRWN